LSREERWSWIDAGNGAPSLTWQCEVLGLARSSFYYCPAAPSAEDLMLMNLIDAQYTKTPF